MITDIFFEQLEISLPAVISRQEVGKYTGGLVSPKTLANADSKGTGPSIKVRIGRRIGYTRASLIEWLRSQVK